MIYLDVTPSTVTIFPDTPEETVRAHVALTEGLKSKNPQAHMINSKIDLRFTEPVPYWHVAYDEITRTFPRGLIFTAAKVFKDAELEFQVRTLDRGNIVLTPDDFWWDDKGEAHCPRDYQMAAAQAWINSHQGIVVVPTRGGKTLIGCLAASAADGKANVLWLVTKNEAKADVLATWAKQMGPEPDASFFDFDVMTYTTATKRDLTKYGLVIADEVHRIAADTYYDAIQGATNAWYRLGLTGTPEGRSDGKEIFIEGAIGPVVYQIPRKLLIERGLCSSGKTWRLILDTPMYMPPEAPGNWSAIEKHGIVENEARDNLFVRGIRKARGNSEEQVLVLCRRQAHAEALAAKLSAEFGVEVPAMHARRTKKQRADIYAKLASGEINMVVATSIYDDSMTFPHLKILAVPAGGKSSILTGQRMGRVLAGDKKIIIIDCSDEHWETLRGHSKKRFRVYEKEGYPVENVNV